MNKNHTAVTKNITYFSVHKGMLICFVNADTKYLHSDASYMLQAGLKYTGETVWALNVPRILMCRTDCYELFT
jgi:hypothetical protein